MILPANLGKILVSQTFDRSANKDYNLIMKNIDELVRLKVQALVPESRGTNHQPANSESLRRC